MLSACASNSSRDCRWLHKKLAEALAALGRGREADAAFEEFFEQDADKGKVAVALDHLRVGTQGRRARDAAHGAAREPGQRRRDALPRADLFPQQGAAQRRRGAAPPRDVARARPRRGLDAARRDCCTSPVGTASRSTLTGAPPPSSRAMPPPGPGSATPTRHAGDIESSREAYERAVSLDPRAPGAQMGLGHVLKTLGDQPGSLKAYRAAIARQAGVRRGLLEHGEPQGVPLRGR